jgi:hypothetical protein
MSHEDACILCSSRADLTEDCVSNGEKRETIGVDRLMTTLSQFSAENRIGDNSNRN